MSHRFGHSGKLSEQDICFHEDQYFVDYTTYWYNIYFFVARLVNKCSGGDVFNNH